MKLTVLLVATAQAALSTPALAGSSDRHEGVYRFRDAPVQHCIEQVRRARETPSRPMKLSDLPPAYAVRLKNGQEAWPSPCFRLERER